MNTQSPCIPLAVPPEYEDLPVGFLRSGFLTKQLENARANGFGLACVRTEWCERCRDEHPHVFELESVTPRRWLFRCLNPKHPKAVVS